MMQNNALPKNLIDALARCDELVDEKLLEYFYQLYDPETGGFYYSISSRDSVGPTPFAEGTCFTIEALLDGGMTLPDWYKEKVSAWIMPHQDPDDGYYYETLWGKNTAGPRKDRDLSYSTIILNRCGKKPLYPLPQERMQSGNNAPDTIPPYLAGEKEMIAFMDSLDWSTKAIWGTGQKFAAGSSMIRAAGLFEVVHNYAKARQNPETGLWGDDLTWMNTNGAMKLSSYFADPAHPYPHMEEMLDSVLKIYSGDVPPTSATWIWNPFVLIRSALRSMGENAPAMRAKLYEKGANIVHCAIDNALLLRREDGGFASSIHRATPTQQGYIFGLGLSTESDLDGTVIAGHRLRSTIHDVFDAPCSHDYFLPYETDFWERLKQKPSVRKTLPYLECKKV